ncbi:MAG: hypothetical protein KDE35_00025 [Geminicoccaceae bacterium]|nr:hypothetical protein [Geminicoccaceae bacterium]
MLGLSLSKLIFTVLIIVAIWRGFKLFESFKKRLADEQEKPPAEPRVRAKAKAEPVRPTGRTVDLVKCVKCGAYVPNGTICPSVEECTHRRSS